MSTPDRNIGAELRAMLHGLDVTETESEPVIYIVHGADGQDFYMGVHQPAAFGPQLPDRADVWLAQGAYAHAQANGSDADYERAMTEKHQTENAFNQAADREAAAFFEDLEAGE
jgi:hypothetical protein